MLAKSNFTTLNGLVVVTIASLVPINSFGQVPAPPQAPAIAQPQNGQAPNALPAPNGLNAQDGMQVLDEGPLHEAFAEAVVLENAQAITVQREPPVPINELVPEVRPEGENIEWIPGYWMWSDQQNDFIWVSGVWRDIPPGRRWVPGHWTANGADFQWIPGFWAGEQVQEVQMLPLPPETLEVGPSSPAPAANFFWVPGCWMWNNNAYSWRAGYWYAGQQNWVWIPDRYCYTPRGVIFVSGYWDYLLASRGLAYAPVWWSRPVWRTPGWGYRPYNALNSGLLLSALYLNRHHHHYYYGRGGWNNGNYNPWWKNGGGRGYDPFCSYHRWHDGRNRDDWSNKYRQDFNRFQQDFNRPGNGGRRNDLLTQADLNRHQEIGNVKLRQVSKIDVDRSRQQISQFNNIRDARTQAEIRQRIAGADGKITFDDVKNAPDFSNERNRPNGRSDLASQRGQGADRGRETGGANREVLRGNAKQLDGMAAAGSNKPSFKLPPVARTTAKVPTGDPAVRVDNGRGAATRNGSYAERMQPNGAFQGGQANGMKFEELQRHLRSRGPEGSATRGPDAVRRAAAAQDNAKRAAVSPEVIRNGRTLNPNSGGSASNIEGFRTRESGGRTNDVRRQLNLDASSSFPQGSGRTMEGRARIEMPQNRLLTPGNISQPREMQYRSRNLQVPGSSSSSGQPRVREGGGQPSFRGMPSGGGGGGEMRSSRGPSGGGGGGPSMRSSGGGGGGSAFRGSSGGGGGRGNGGGGGGGSRGDGGRSRR